MRRSMKLFLVLGLLLPVVASAQIHYSPMSGETILYSANLLALTTSGTSEEVLKTVSIPAGSLGASGAYQSVDINVGLSAAANTNSKTYNLRIGGIGGTAIATTTGDTSSGNRFSVWCHLFPVDSTHMSGTCTNSRSTGTSFLFVAALNSTTLNFGAAIDVTVTGTTAVQAGDLTLTYMRVALRREGA